MTGSNILGCNAAGTVARHHCNQGVGNGPEGCDPGNSNQGNANRSNDELGGTPGHPGRQGGNRNGSVAAKGNSNLNSNVSREAAATAARSAAAPSHRGPEPVSTRGSTRSSSLRASASRPIPSRTRAAVASK
jgi:hypothetical protein